jgi:hypothetical protein
MPIFPALISNSGGNKPAPPTNITLTAASSSSLNASWTGPIYTGKHPLSSYIISLYDSSGVLINASYATVAHPSTSTTITGLSASTAYSIRITLRNSINIDSDLSLASSNATTSAPPPPPTPPPVGTTWYCTVNAVGNGVSYSTSSSNDTGSICNSYAVSCSTSGFPAVPSIPTCSTPTKPPTKSPTPPPTKSPTKPPTKSPTPPPTKSPTKPPTPTTGCVPGCRSGCFCFGSVCGC